MVLFSYCYIYLVLSGAAGSLGLSIGEMGKVLGWRQGHQEPKADQEAMTRTVREGLMRNLPDQ